MKGVSSLESRVSSLLLVALVLAAPGAQAANALAVLPFKNLNADQSIDWLKLGIAETMVADLKKAGHTMVERDQVDKALAELALQGQKLDEDSRAAQAGKLMGANSVVVGGYQKAGDQLRITARFVAVETGVVQRTAKVTGKLTDVFSLQDQIVAELVQKPAGGGGGGAKGRSAPVRRPGTQKTLAAYKSYSMALSSSSQADRIEKLQEALELDPDFSYAADDLNALKERLNVYEQKASKKADEAGKKLFAELSNTSLSLQDRNMKAVMYFSGLLQRQRWYTVAEDAQKIYAMKLPPSDHINAREQASMYLFMALKTLKKNDLALQAGERHLKEFGDGQMAGSVDMQMRFLVEEIQRNEDKRKAYPEEMAKYEKDTRAPRSESDVLMQAYNRCRIPCQQLMFAEADKACGAFLEKYRGSVADQHNFVPLGGWLYAINLAERGDFVKARALMVGLQKDYPDWAKKQSIDSLMRSWPVP